jgi:hypothetical protein
VHEGELENTLEGVQNAHLALVGGIGGNLNLISGDAGGVVLFYVGLPAVSSIVRLCIVDLHFSIGGAAVCALRPDLQPMPVLPPLGQALPPEETCST